MVTTNKKPALDTQRTKMKISNYIITKEHQTMKNGKTRIIEKLQIQS